jgi:hypothetical protein
VIFNSEAGPLRIHPIITLIGEEWDRAGDARTAADFSAFSIAKVSELCASVEAEHPKWNAKLFKTDLPTLLEAQDSVHWWLPGEEEEDEEEEEEEEEDEDEDEDEDEVPGVYYIYYTLCLQLMYPTYVSSCPAWTLGAPVRLRACSACWHRHPSGRSCVGGGRRHWQHRSDGRGRGWWRDPPEIVGEAGDCPVAHLKQGCASGTTPTTF